jgi:phage tail sheath protein FI
MAEYLSPGVYIEEIPSSLRAIEGVSTSTAAFVGPANRGPVPGYIWPGSGTPLPFTPAGGFLLTADPSPVLVTSFAEFQRTFGPPLPIATPGDPTDYGYLGWAIKAFFDNGGKRAFIARVVSPAATPSTITMEQGVAYTLLRSASKNDQTVYLTSSRGLNVSDAVTFKTHTQDGNGTNVFGHPAQPAIAVGGTPPFALKNGDSLKVTVSGAPAVTATWNASAAQISTKNTSFPGLPGTTLLLTVGSTPTQTIPFIGDAITPLSTTPTVAEVLAFLARFASGVTVQPGAGPTSIVIQTLTAGSGATIQVAGTAVVPLGLGAPTAGSGDAANISQTTIAEIATKLSAVAGLSVGPSSAGALQIAGAAAGASHSIELDEEPAGSGLLSRLGYGPVTTVTAFGSDAVPATLTIASYNAQQNSISFTARLGAILDATKVYLLGPATYAPGASGTSGPKFIARSAGSWSANVSVLIASSDRQPVAVTSPVTTNFNVVPVQNVSSFYIGGTVEIDHNGQTRTVHQVTDINQGLRQLTIDPPLAGALALPASVRTLEINITVTDLTGAAPTETYKGMAWAQGGSADVRRHYAWTINANSRLVWVQPPAAANETFDVLDQPTTSDGFPVQPTGAMVGVDGLPTTDDDWIGQDNGLGMRSGIESLKDLSEVSIIAAPGKTSHEIQLALIDQCELLRYRFAVLDGEKDPIDGSITSILGHRNLYDTSFAAYYQPWVTVTVDGQTRTLPPSGYLAGIYARVDNARGVWKAPANETVLNISGLKTVFTTGEQDLLNPRGVNLIRQFDQGGIRVWGARTLSSDPDVKYINVRRTLIFLEASIDRGTQWVVFEPNTPETWVRVTDSVSAFLLTQWRNGALFGRKPEEAFFVRCDETTMTADDILNGRLICHIGVAIVRPAEFVIFRIEQITNFGKTS